MDIVEAITNRKSIRNFKPTPVPRTILEELLKASCRATSSVNQQPWEFAVVSGDLLETINYSDKCLSEAGSVLDIGAVMQNICMTALKYEMVTCI